MLPIQVISLWIDISNGFHGHSMCILIRSLLLSVTSNTISSRAPSLLSSATSSKSSIGILNKNYFSWTISVISNELSFFNFPRDIVIASFLHCRFPRYLSWNQLNGTIPPEIGNLSQVKTLYVLSLMTFCLSIFNWIHDRSLVLITSLLLSQVPHV